MADAKLKEIIENAAKRGSFGENLTFVDLIPSDKEGEDQFASDVVFAQVKLENGTVQKDVSVVIKRQQKIDAVREMMGSDKQFYNEHLMYSEILPFLENKCVVKEIFPKYYYSFATLGERFEDDIVVVEDLKGYGFKLTEERLFLDLDHCVVALKALGEFHALSYAKKQANKAEFLEKVGKLKDVNFEAPDQEESDRFLVSAMERGVLPVIKAGEHVSVLEKFLERAKNPSNLRKELNQPEEPIAVLCHGDFNRNNMLFRYDDNGKPAAVKLFDVATSRYASPAIDLAFFLFMNTTAELRKAHWDDLLLAYHQSLSSTVAGCQVPTLQEVHAELSKKGAYGYLITSFFLPMMMAENPSKADVEEFINMPPEVALELSRSQGGDKVTGIVADIVRDLARIGAL